MNPDYTLNAALFDEVGPPRMSANLRSATISLQNFSFSPCFNPRWGYFFSYVAYLGSFVSCALFQGPQIWKAFKAARAGDSIFDNKLTQMIRKYPQVQNPLTAVKLLLIAFRHQVPLWWNFALFFAPAFVLLGLVLKKDILYMPIYS
jgi:hypothetical protein